MKLDILQLRKAIAREEFDYTLLTSTLSSYSGIRQKINELLKAGVILRVKKGLYVFGSNYSEAPICKELLANLIYGPSYISLEYALAYHGIIPERVESITSVTPKRSKEFKTPLGRFSYLHLGLDKYPHGIELISIDRMHSVLMASPEKALCDYIAFHKIELTSTAEAKKFLSSDLRIDPHLWHLLHPHSLENLNKFYKKHSIAFIQEAL